jgi:quercetin dioxygenase-like cupin family protein
MKSSDELTVSSCELPAKPAAAKAGSRVIRFQPEFRWEGIPVNDYKASAEHWCGVARMALVGETGENTRFHVRYFEIAPDGFSSRESHQHEHVVIVLRGRGVVEIGDQRQELSFGDTVYVAPRDIHQFRNPYPDPFGFLCVVDAERDRPVLALAKE